MLNEATNELIKSFESLKLKAYPCPAGVWTIGYGHTSAAGSPKVTKGMTITADRAEEIYLSDMAKFEASVRRLLRRPANGNQLGAFCSLAMNIGIGAFASSTTLKRFNAGNFAGAAEALTWWNKATDDTGKKVVLRGLVRRREAERALFLTPIEEEIEEAPEPDAMPREGVSGGEAKSLGKSKTVGLSTVILGGAAGEALGVFSELREVIPEVAAYAPYVLAGLALLVILNRWNDSRRGIH